MSDLRCFTLGCTDDDCEHLRWLDVGKGTWVQQCSPACNLQVAEPGRAECDCSTEPRWAPPVDGYVHRWDLRRRIEDVELP